MIVSVSFLPHMKEALKLRERTSLDADYNLRKPGDTDH